ncbi:MAG: exo-alpha-sialidase [bacterium]|nr:exo-alpha-sialidase [bacterium]
MAKRTDRREFLKSATAATVGPAALAACATSGGAPHRISVSRRLFWESPYSGCAIMPSVDSYVSNTGQTLIGALSEHVQTPNDQATYVNNTIIRSEDNGETWSEVGPFGGQEIKPDGIHLTFPPSFFLDPATNVLVRFYPTRHITDGDYWGHSARVNMKEYFQISRDGGLTWTDARQLIQDGPEYDEIRWADGVEYGKSSGYMQNRGLSLRDGAMLFSFQNTLSKDLVGPGKFGSMEIRAVHARWSDDRETLKWRMGAPLRLPWEASPIGVCESPMARLKDGRLLCVTRSNRNAKTGSPSIKYRALSSDDGLTWTEPQPFTYDDGSRLYSPASFSRLERSSKTGKLYFLGNVLEEDSPSPNGQGPRHPLVIAEVNEENMGVRKETITIIDDQKEGDLPRTYSNFGVYEDRETRDFVVTMCEECALDLPMSPEKWTAHAYRYDICFG